MKTLILTLLFLVANSCDPVNSESRDETSENPTAETKDDNGNISPPIQESVNPGEITLKIKVMEVFDTSKDICGISKANVMKMAVQEILERGSSIVNVPNKNDELLLNFMLPPKDLATNNLIEAKARESLCRDASKTYFTIISYKIVE